MEVKPLSIDVLTQLPEHSLKDCRNQLIKARFDSVDTIIVLDDDPTGTQTVHDIPVLTEWSKEAIRKEFEQGTPLFYILTNSRSLDQQQAVDLATEIGQNIITAANSTHTRYWVISRSDSTLRGHYPAEVDALKQALHLEGGIHFIIPAFFEGGRYTLNDVHYVEQGHHLIPASETPYANDPVFGFKQANLKHWITEKTKGRVNPDRVASISLQELRQSTTEQLSQKIASVQPNGYCVINAASYTDLEVFNLALIQSGVIPVFRTAASQVAALACQEPKSLLTGPELIIENGAGGLIVVGSFVSTTTEQLNHLFRHAPHLQSLELSVTRLLDSEPEMYLEQLSKQLNETLSAGKSTVLYTSRELITDPNPDQNLRIGQRVSESLTEMVSNLSTTPRFLVTKGGITSSDVATKALGVKRAMVQGQVIKGVPVWRLSQESRFPGLHQIIFPGNVGDEASLTKVIKLLIK